MNPPTVIFKKVEKKNQFLFFLLFYPPTLNSICFVEKNNIFLMFCLCIFESDTVKGDLSYAEFKDLIQTVGFLY